MPVKTTSPEISALKVEIEKHLGRSISSRADFLFLVSDIERVTREHLAENTLRRIWGAIKGYDTVFIRTLDVLCRYIGYEHWNNFCDILKKRTGKESEIVNEHMSIRSENLKPGERIRICWLPDRTCVVEYIGGRVFKAIETKNSTLQVGDTFECSMMILNYPLFLDNLVHGGELCQRYSIGLENGITTLEKL